MEKRWLEDILILLEEGNMTRAAERRNITQPAFSRRIRAFEDWLGTPILKRGSNRIEFSRAITESEEDLRAIVTSIRDLRGRIANFDPSAATVNIAAQHSFSFSTFPDMASQAKHHFPSVSFRLRSANLRDCVTMFLRGEASMLLCYESRNAGPLPFDKTVARCMRGQDKLVPVVGGALRHLVTEGGEISDQTPSIVYPAGSYFGEILGEAELPFSTRNLSKNPFCETAFSNSIMEMALKGLGVGWLPFSMIHKEIEAGTLVSLEDHLGKEDLTIALYAKTQDEICAALLDFWRLG